MNKRRRFKAKRKRAQRQKVLNLMNGIQMTRNTDWERFPVYEKIVLSPKDFGAFVETLASSPAPNAALKALLMRQIFD